MSRVGIRDVGLRAGVSISTVSNALNKPGTVGESLAGRIRAAVAELDTSRSPERVVRASTGGEQ